MRAFSRRWQNIPALAVGLTVFWLQVWTAAGLAGDPDWNRQNLDRLKVPPGNTLSFAVLGDNRSNPPVFTEVLQQLARDPDLAFALEVGDLVETGTVDNFAAFLKQVRQNLSLPFLTAIGNHDLDKNGNPGLYRRIFGPASYAFHLRDNYFIVFNNVDPQGIGEPQWRWLERELQKSQTYQTRLVFLHIPLFDPRGGENHHCLPEAAGRRLAALFRQYRVTHVFAGHIHGYFSGNWDGVPYTISAGAGAPLYGTDPEHFFYHYLKVTLKDGKIHLRVHRLAAAGQGERHE
jgi:3',5'-cyclic AMP phosphodiesterase CpdA